MTARRSPRPLTRPHTTNTSRLFESSTAGWYAAWKARQNTAPVEPTPPAASAPTQQDDPAEALAKWLTGGVAPQA